MGMAGGIDLNERYSSQYRNGLLHRDSNDEEAQANEKSYACAPVSLCHLVGTLSRRGRRLFRPAFPEGRTADARGEAIFQSCLPRCGPRGEFSDLERLSLGSRMQKQLERRRIF